MITQEFFYDFVNPHLFFFLFQLSFCLLHFVDKHLSHFFFFALQLHKKFLPLGFVRLLQAEDQGKVNNMLTLLPYNFTLRSAIKSVEQTL